MITAKINVSKIDKARLFKGEKGTYLDIVLVETPDSQYGDDYVIYQSVSKEEREKGVKGAILGNGKIRGGVAKKEAAPKQAPKQADNLDEDSVPF